MLLSFSCGNFFKTKFRRRCQTFQNMLATKCFVSSLQHILITQTRKHSQHNKHVQDKGELTEEASKNISQPETNSLSLSCLPFRRVNSAMLELNMLSLPCLVLIYSQFQTIPVYIFLVPFPILLLLLQQSQATEVLSGTSKCSEQQRLMHKRYDRSSGSSSSCSGSCGYNSIVSVFDSKVNYQFTNSVLHNNSPAPHWGTTGVLQSGLTVRSQ